MKMYLAFYKCRLCGKTFYNAGTTEKDTASNAIIHTVLKASGYTPQIKSPNAPMPFDVHSCGDGSYGMSDFLGMKESQKKEE